MEQSHKLLVGKAWVNSGGAHMVIDIIEKIDEFVVTMLTRDGLKLMPVSRSWVKHMFEKWDWLF